jgi:hypothetical protein
MDGYYSGSVHIDYEVIVPLIGGDSECDGWVRMTYDSSQPTPFSGELSCDWPIFDIWAALWMGDVTGTMDGRTTGGFNARGDVWGRDALDYFIFSATWNATMSGPTIDGTFNGGTFLFDNYNADFSVTFDAPL